MVKLGGFDLSGVKKILAGALALSGLAFAFWPEPPPPPPPPRTEVVFWHMWTAEWKKVIDRIADRYNASQTKYHVTAVSVPSANNTATAKFLLAAVGANPPDLMAQWLPVVPNWADNGLIRPLDDLLTPDERRLYAHDVYPIVRRMGTYKGKLYGICTGIGMSGVYMNTTQVRAAGFDPDAPIRTLEDLDRMADRLDVVAKSGDVRRIGFMPWSLPLFSEVFGGGLYDWERGKVTIDSPANRRALTYIVSRRKKLGYDRVLKFDAGLTGQDDAGGWRFITGAYSMQVDGPWRVEQMGKFAPEMPYRTLAIPPPASGGRTEASVSNGNFILIPTAARHPEGAMDFARFWSGLQDPERAAEFYTWGGWLPLTPAIANAPAYQAYLRKFPRFRTFVDMMPSPNLRSKAPVAYQEFLDQVVSKAEEAAVRGEKSPAQALQDAERELARELKRRKELGFRD